MKRLLSILLFALLASALVGCTQVKAVNSDTPAKKPSDSIVTEEKNPASPENLPSDEGGEQVEDSIMVRS